MLTIVADTCGRHDTLGGACSDESNTVRYAHRQALHARCRDNFLLADRLSDCGLTKRDMTSNINFFMNVPVDARRQADVRGRHLRRRQVRRDARRDGRARADLSNCPQINNPCNGYNPTPVRLLIWDT